MPKLYDDFYCLKQKIYCFRTKNVNRNKKVCRKKICNVIMHSEDTKKLVFNQYQKSDKAPFNIYADLECITENYPENSSRTKVSGYFPSGFSISTISSFKSTESKHDVCHSS